MPGKEHHSDIRIGTVARLKDCGAYLRQVVEHGFECFELTCHRLDDIDLVREASDARAALGGRAVISSVAIYGNPLQDPRLIPDWERLIDECRSFGCNVVCGFSGALEDRPVDESIPTFKQVFGPLAKRAEDRGVKIGFENCDMGGSWERPRWNIAHSPRAWELMFDAVPSPALGLEWEPCHQMVSLIDPIAQLRTWAPKVVHVHGKDATVARDVLATRGMRSGEPYVWHRTPGFGDTNWADVITILRQAGFCGAIDIEGWHDPVYCDELEMTGQVRALRYLQECRGGAFVPNPEVVPA